MCGVAGAFGYVDSKLIQAVEQVSAAQLHRGPDGHGLWFSSEGEEQAVFAHRRLAIIDLTEGGHQPMVHRETGNTLCFNGEIYNYKILREELQQLGHHFCSESDGEVLLVAYCEWGEACVERLHGMFAFALWDNSKSRVLLARDRLGVKPLYLSNVEIEGRPVTLFASELRALLASELIPRKLSSEALQTYLWNGFVQGPQSIVEGVVSLEAGSLRWLEAGVTSESRAYWSLASSASKTGNEAELRSRLLESVDERLISDVPLGVFLSGGIDSSAVAALASEKAGDQMRTFNVCFDEDAFDESRWARKVAHALKADHSEIKLTQQLFESDLDNALDSLDQPTFDGINTYFVSKAVREAGITVALSGAGGDELFGGYTSFKDLPLAQKVSRVGGRVGASLARRTLGFSQGGRELPRQTRWGKLADVLDTRGAMVPLYQVSYALFTREFLDEISLLPSSSAPWGLSPARASALSAMVKDQTPLEAISTLELTSFVGERLLRDTDCASMRVSLEVRVPLLDHKVVEQATKLDTPLRYHPLGKKMALRRASLEKLDPSIFERPKSGFVLPIEQWSRQRLESRITDAFSDEAACKRVGLRASALNKLWRAYSSGESGIYWSRIWSLFVLLCWCQKHRVALNA